MATKLVTFRMDLGLLDLVNNHAETACKYKRTRIWALADLVNRGLDSFEAARGAGGVSREGLSHGPSLVARAPKARPAGKVRSRAKALGRKTPKKIVLRPKKR